jgi:hypothetical protein
MVPVLAGAAILALPATTMAPMLSPASASMRSSLMQGPEIVNVNVSFNSQVPLVDTSDEAIARTQKTSRRFIYRMAVRECAVLKETIAETCRLTNLNVSTNVQHRSGNNPVMLNLNGNAQFAISLKSDSAN